jgi:hypothetical protein
MKRIFKTKINYTIVANGNINKKSIYIRIYVLAYLILVNCLNLCWEKFQPFKLPLMTVYNVSLENKLMILIIFYKVLKIN